MKTPCALVLLVAVTMIAHSQDLPSRTTGCLPRADFAMAGVRFTDTAATVKKRLGKPGRITTHTSEDDGGRYEVTRYAFAEVEVDVARNYVESVATSSKRVVSPAGLRVGMVESEVARRLGYAPLGPEPRKVSLGPCGDLGQEELLLVFRRIQVGHPAVLVRIEISNYGP